MIIRKREEPGLIPVSLDIICSNGWVALFATQCDNKIRLSNWVPNVPLYRQLLEGLQKEVGDRFIAYNAIEYAKVGSTLLNQSGTVMDIGLVF